MRIRRRNLAWLTILGALVMVAVLSGAALTPAATIMLIALYAFAVAASVLEFQPTRLIDQSRSSLTQMRMSAEAREAVERARRRTGATTSGLTVLDVGLITSQSNREGMVMRKTRSVSLDDDGVRPFVTIHVQPERADQQVLLRFELSDGSGSQRYVHEMKTYLREGEMNILADHHLPLVANNKLEAGDWDLRVFVDGALNAAHSFSMTPSLRERYRRFEEARADAPRGESAREERVSSARSNLSEPAPKLDEQPLSLEELLRSRSESRQSSRRE